MHAVSRKPVLVPATELAAQRGLCRNIRSRTALPTLWCSQGDDKMIKYVMPAAMVLAMTVPAFAAEYYIVRGSDQKCRVVETRPADKTVVVIGDKAYVTREEADKQMAVVCKSR
jgi:hypothetical protein